MMMMIESEAAAVISEKERSRMFFFGAIAKMHTP
jgi:hypothetical protein